MKLSCFALYWSSPTRFCFLFPLRVACISLAFRGILGIKIGSFVYSGISNHVDTKISIFISPDGRHLNRGSCNTLIFTPKIPLHPSCISLYNHKLSGLCYHSSSFELCLWGSRAFEPLWLCLLWLVTNPYYLKMKICALDCTGLIMDQRTRHQRNSINSDFRLLWVWIFILVSWHLVHYSLRSRQTAQWDGSVSSGSPTISSTKQHFDSYQILKWFHHDTSYQSYFISIKWIDFSENQVSQCKVNRSDHTKSSITLQVWPELNFLILHHIELTSSTKVLYLALSTTFMLSAKVSLEWKRSIRAKTFQVS